MEASVELNYSQVAKCLAKVDVPKSKLFDCEQHGYQPLYEFDDTLRVMEEACSSHWGSFFMFQGIL